MNTNSNSEEVTKLTNNPVIQGLYSRAEALRSANSTILFWVITILIAAVFL